MLTALLLACAPSDLEHFEAHVRPVLIERCYRCHNSVDRMEGGLALDHAEGLLAGGHSGPAIVPGDALDSLLFQAVSHADDAPRMPREEPKLEPEELEALHTWIDGGAYDPRDQVPTAEDYAAETSWEDIRERRLNWWSYQPISDPPVPRMRSTWPRSDVDRFIWKRAGGSMPPELEPAQLLRRATFVLTGLPPTPEELEAFLADDQPGAYERAVDRLLESPQYAERFARHWMDLVRYADSHGSEGDPAIPNAWLYRNYLIQAFDEDLPWDQLIQEHVAGDLIEPRIRKTLNHAAIGPAHFRFVLHGYAPVEPLDEKVRFIDNQIEVLGKAFQAQTWSCARCHDHKFDPVSQADYYALYGILASERAAQRTINDAQVLESGAAQLRELKAEIRAALAEDWRAALPGLAMRTAALDDAAKDPAHAIHPWARCVDSGDMAAEWEACRDAFTGSTALTQDFDGWTWAGNGPELAREGDFIIGSIGEDVGVEAVVPRGIYSHLLSNRAAGLLTSPEFEAVEGNLYVRSFGGGEARARYAIQSFPRTSGPVFPHHNPGGNDPDWHHWNLDYWAGDQIYLELATARDIPIEVRGSIRSWWGVTDMRMVPKGEPAPKNEAAEFQAPLFDSSVTPKSQEELEALYVAKLAEVIDRFEADACRPGDARFLGTFTRYQILPTRIGHLKTAGPLIRRYQLLERGQPVPIRVPGLVAGDRVDAPLYDRGDPRKPGEPVPQSFVAWLDGEPYTENGRLELARDLVRPDNPLTARVAVHRIWTWVFGEGLVPSVDNFGRLGEEPTDPELLDHLATRFLENGQSIKGLVRELVTSSTFRASRPAHRLDAESLRDAMLAVTGRLDDKRLGPSVSESTPRRSLYVNQRRTSPPPFLAAFDQPVPHTTCGLRPVTNVPAQALALLNDDLVIESARHWARNLSGSDEERIEAMYLAALSRKPSQVEREAIAVFLEERGARYERILWESKLEELFLEESRAEREAILAAATERALESRPEETPLDLPVPYANWEFDGDASDGQGRLPGELHGQAKIEGGVLVLDGGSMFTPALPVGIKAKTLEAWVRLRDLDQSGSGLITVQTTNGNLFDSIVFGERQPRRWIAGSNHFQRTQDVDGPEESLTDWVHLAVTWSADGEVSVYRGGTPYGSSYSVHSQVTFPKGVSQVLIGGRHGTRGSVRGTLRGDIDRAALFDRALSAEEIAALAGGRPNFVSSSERLAAMTDTERARLAELDAGIDASEARYAAMQPDLSTDKWQELAHAILQLEEFRYLR